MFIMLTRRGVDYAGVSPCSHGSQYYCIILLKCKKKKKIVVVFNIFYKAIYSSVTPVFFVFSCVYIYIYIYIYMYFYGSLKGHHLYEMSFFYIINVFSVTFDQFKGALSNI